MTLRSLLLVTLIVLSSCSFHSYAGEDTAEFLTPQVENQEISAPETTPVPASGQNENPVLSAKIRAKIRNRGKWSYQFELIKPTGESEILTHYRETSMMKPASTLKMFTAWMAFQQQAESPEFLKPMLQWSINADANQALNDVDALNPVSNEDTSHLTDVQILALHTRSFTKFYAGKLTLNASNFHAVDGCGLSYSNKLTAQIETDLLSLIRSSSDYDTFKKLMVTPSTGTLLEEHRFKDFAYPLYAKTGTLADTASLTGFVEVPEGTLMFSMISNQLSVSLADARTIIDSTVVDHVEFLKSRTAAHDNSH